MTYDFEDQLEWKDANRLETALEAALTAMAHFGSDNDHMMTLSEVRIVALKAKADAFRREENERRADAALKS